MSKSGGIKKKALQTLLSQYKGNLSAYEKAYVQYTQDLNTIESGMNTDGDQGLWSGAKASQWVTKAKQDAVMYATLYNALDEIEDKLQIALNELKYDK